MIRAPSPSKLDAMAELLDEFAILRSKRRAARRQQMNEFLSLFQQLHLKLLTTGPVSFNVFSVLGVTGDEVRQSAFLAWLLNVTSGHRQGTTFLHSFLKACDICIDLGPMDLPEVYVEHRERESIIDIMILVRGQLLVYIENKVYAQEGPDQLNREFRDMRRLGKRLGVPENGQFAVFLTPDGREPVTGESSGWYSLSYRKLAENFESILPDITSDKLRHTVSDWIAIAQHIGETQ